MTTTSVIIGSTRQGRFSEKPLADVRLGTRVLGDNHPSVALGDHELSSLATPSRNLRGRFGLPILPDLAITKTMDEVIVYHSNRPHVGIHDRRSNETESATLKVLAERIGFDRSRRNLSHELLPVKL